MVYFTTFGDTKLAFPLGHFFVYKVPYFPNILNPDTTTAQLFISRLFISLLQTRTDSPPGAPTWGCSVPYSRTRRWFRSYFGAPSAHYVSTGSMS